MAVVQVQKLNQQDALDAAVTMVNAGQPTVPGNSIVIVCCWWGEGVASVPTDSVANPYALGSVLSSTLQAQGYGADGTRAMNFKLWILRHGISIPTGGTISVVLTPPVIAVRLFAWEYSGLAGTVGPLVSNGRGDTTWDTNPWQQVVDSNSLMLGFLLHEGTPGLAPAGDISSFGGTGPWVTDSWTELLRPSPGFFANRPRRLDRAGKLRSESAVTSARFAIRADSQIAQTSAVVNYAGGFSVARASFTIQTYLPGALNEALVGHQSGLGPRA